MLDLSDPWIISDHSYEPQQELQKSSAYALGNGYLGNRGSLEECEDSDRTLVGTYLNGVYDRSRGRDGSRREIVNIPDWTRISLRVDGRRFSIEQCPFLRFHRWMDLREAMLSKELVGTTSDGKKLTVRSERFLSSSDHHHGFLQWTVTVDHDADIGVESGVSARVANVSGGGHFGRIRTGRRGDALCLETATREMGYAIVFSCTNHVSSDHGSGIDTSVSRAGDGIADRFGVALRAGQSFRITKTVTVFTSRDSIEDPAAACRREHARTLEIGYERCKARHLDRWRSLWQWSDMVIVGDARSQIGIRFAIYHLLASAPYFDDRVSFPVRSLSGQDHGGSIYWDTDIFVLPFFTYTFPSIARNMLMYRYRTLDGARDKARTLGYRGAYYPFSSQENGIEQCPSHIFLDVNTGKRMRNYIWDRQIHISADVAYSLRQYVDTTGDKEFLLEYGLEMLLEIARFHASRVTWNTSRGDFDVTGVMGPDEYHEIVDNNAYTNGMIKESLCSVLHAIDVLSEGDLKRVEEVFSRLKIDRREIDEWKKIYALLRVKAPDPRTSLIEQFDGYNDLEECGLADVLARKIRSDQYLGGVGGIVEKTKVLKQADVAMLLYLLRQKFPTHVKEANWRFYEKRTEHGSSLSPMAYAVVAADAGMAVEAYSYFLHTLLMDLEPGKEHFSGYYNHGVHPCALSGAWLTIVHGFFGVTLMEDGVLWRTPCIPGHWIDLRFRLRWRNSRIEFSYSKPEYRAVLLDDDPSVEVPVFIGERIHVLRAGSPVVRETSRRPREGRE